MSKSIMLDKSKEFAINTVKVCKELSVSQKEFVLTKQLIKSATSIGANIHESKYAQSTADFVSKMKIALKECYESEYWLEILFKTEYLNETAFEQLNKDCSELRRMLISSIRTVTNNENSSHKV